VVLVGVFAVVRFLASRTCFLEGRLSRCSGGGGLSVYDFLCKNLRGDWWQGGDSSLEVVAAALPSMNGQVSTS